MAKREGYRVGDRVKVVNPSDRTHDGDYLQNGETGTVVSVSRDSGKPRVDVRFNSESYYGGHKREIFYGSRIRELRHVNKRSRTRRPKRRRVSRRRRF